MNDETRNGYTDRAYAIAVEHYGLARFAHPFVLADGDPCRWSMSPDVFQGLVLEMGRPELRRPMETPDGDRLYGLPLTVDPTLPLDTLRLEPERPSVARIVARPSEPSEPEAR